jgi:L-fuculose-phosphate aldolase
VRFGRFLYEKRLVTGTSGNLSGRVDDRSMVITPSGACKGLLREYDLIRMNLDGDVTAGERPSMEAPFHLAFYRNVPEVGAVIHCHPMFCSLLAAAGQNVRTDYTPEGLMVLERVAFVPYATPGSEGLADNLSAAMAKGARAFVLENHGAITVGKDIAEAFHRMETLEYLAELQVRGEGNKPIKALPSKEVEKILGMGKKGR